MNLYLTQDLLDIPIINVKDANKLGEVSNIRLKLQEGNVSSYEFVQKIPFEDSLLEEKTEQGQLSQLNQMEAVPITERAVHHTPHTAVAMPSVGAGAEWAYQEVKHTYEVNTDQVQVLSKDALLVQNNKYHKNENKTTDNGMNLESVKGMEVITDQDQNLGKINDLLIDAKTHSIEAIELSEGFWKDLLAGKNQYIPFPQKMVVQDGNIIVPHDFEKKMVEHPIDLF
jgi:uncharacterized protein YrrD